MSAIPTDLNDAQTERLSVKVPKSMLDRVDEIAFAESSPKNRVSRSDVARFAIADYINAHESSEQDTDAEDE